MNLSLQQEAMMIKIYKYRLICHESGFDVVEATIQNMTAFNASSISPEQFHNRSLWNAVTFMYIKVHLDRAQLLFHYLIQQACCMLRSHVVMAVRH